MQRLQKVIGAALRVLAYVETSKVTFLVNFYSPLEAYQQAVAAKCSANAERRQKATSKLLKSLEEIFSLLS